MMNAELKGSANQFSLNHESLCDAYKLQFSIIFALNVYFCNYQLSNSPSFDIISYYKSVEM